MDLLVIVPIIIFIAWMVLALIAAALCRAAARVDADADRLGPDGRRPRERGSDRWGAAVL